MWLHNFFIYIINKYIIVYGFSCNLEKHTLVRFSKTSNCTRPSDSCNFDRLWKTHSCMFYPNCTRSLELYKHAWMKNGIVYYYNLYVFTRFLLLCLCVNPVLALFCRFWKPFNPLLGETFEYIDEERGYTVIAEQVYCDVAYIYYTLCRTGLYF